MEEIKRIIKELSKEEIEELIYNLLSEISVLYFQGSNYKKCINKPYTTTRCNETYIQEKCQLCILKDSLELVKEDYKMKEDKS